MSNGGVLFHAGLGKDLLFKSVLGHCSMYLYFSNFNSKARTYIPTGQRFLGMFFHASFSIPLHTELVFFCGDVLNKSHLFKN
jgi:hypothetical protein